MSVGSGRGVHVSVGGRGVELGGDSVVAVGGAVVFVGMVVFVGDDGGCCVASLGGLGVRVGATTVYIGSVGKFVGMGVSLGEVVFVSLGVTVKISVDVSVVFLDSVKVNNADFARLDSRQSQVVCFQEIE